MLLSEWIARQPRGAKSELMYRTRLSWTTICEVCNTNKAGTTRVAKLISDATDGAVSVDDLCTKPE